MGKGDAPVPVTELDARYPTLVLRPAQAPEQDEEAS